MSIYLKCENCGKYFIPQRLTAKYCSEKCKKNARNNNRIPKYYCFNSASKKFQVSKTSNGKTTYYGTYSTEEECIKVVEWLKEHKWKRESLKDIKL